MQTMTRNEMNTATGHTKVKQYGWDLNDAPGTLTWLNKGELSVDHAYQREAKNQRVLRIAQKWSWLACGVIVVAKRKTDQRLYVVDGQHRVLAALKRSDIEQLPCLVFETGGAKDEAAGFYDANTGRRLPTGIEKWKAQLLRGDANVVFADALIRQTGHEASVAAGPGTVRCLAALLKAVDTNRDALRRVWPLVTEICQGRSVHERVFEGLLYLEAHLPVGQSLTDRRWNERVSRVGFQGLLDAANSAAAFYARGGAKVWALGMLEALNRGCRIHMVLDTVDAAGNS